MGFPNSRTASVKKENKVHYNGRTGNYTVLCKKDGAVLCHGSHQKVEDFLDWQENLSAEKERKIHHRMSKLLNWLYNNKKRR